MSLTTLHLRNVRNLADVRLDPEPEVNWLSGANGAGKTSVLEGIHLLARGRSFRSGSVSAVVSDGEDALQVFARRVDPEHALGVERSRGDWSGRIDGSDSQRVSDFARRLPLVLVDPGSHALLAGGPDVRRNFLDWAMFHVEPSYLEGWRRYARLLRQRNAALKQNAADRMLDAIESPMVEAAEWVDDLRSRYVEALSSTLDRVQDQLALRMPELNLTYRSLAAGEGSLERALLESRPRDRERGFTSVGPHRAELVIRSGGRLAAPRLSRGQQKLAALMLKLGEFESLDRGAGRPLLLLDDPVSELDSQHLQKLLDWVSDRSAQVWITAVEPPADPVSAVFHVEQGEIRRMV